MKNIAIVGCSFAGLISGYYINKLCEEGASLEFFDRKKKAGDGQTSACATSMRIIRELNLNDSVLKQVNKIRATVDSTNYILNIPQYATFDYELFCQGLKSQIEGKFRFGKGVNPKAIISDFDLVIDATGWSSPIDKNKKMAFGLETLIDVDALDSDALNVYIGKKFIDAGYCWAFPISQNRFRVGVCSLKKLNFEKELEAFVKKRFGEKVNEMYGGYIAFGMPKKLTEKNIVCIGDSAAHTYPISYEGIRPAFFFSKQLALMISDFSKDIISLKELKKKYEQLNESKRTLYDRVMDAQKLLAGESFMMNIGMKLFIKKPMQNKLIKKYFEFM